MFKATLLLKPVFMTVRRDISTSCSLSRWFKIYYGKKTPYTPGKNSPNFSHDWEHEILKPSNEKDILPWAEEHVKSLPPDQRQLFSFGLASKQAQYQHKEEEKIKELGYEPYDDSLSVEIIKMTMRIRYLKYKLSKFPQDVMTNRIARDIVQKRIRALRLLRATQFAEYTKLTEALGICEVKHIDPFQPLEMTDTYKRKNTLRDELYQSRLAKLARFKMQLAERIDDFYSEKEEKLTTLLEQFTQMNLIEKSSKNSNMSEEAAKEQAKKNLQQLFTEVVESRRREALRPAIDSQLEWFRNEELERQKVQAVLAKKEARRLGAFGGKK